MTIVGTLVFLAAYATAVAVPGPGVAALVARVLANGTRGLPAYVAGFAIGDLAWFTAAASGLAAIGAAFHPLLNVIRFGGAAYLLYLAFNIATAEAATVSAAEEREAASAPIRDFMSSLSLTIGNPKPIIFFMALLPTVVDLNKLTFGTAAMLAGLMAATVVAIMSAYALLATRARRLFRNAKAVKALNIGTGAVLTGAAIAIATK